MKVGQVYRLKEDGPWSEKACEKYGYVNIPKGTLYIIDRVILERPKIYNLRALFPKSKGDVKFYEDWTCSPSIIKKYFIRDKAYEEGINHENNIIMGS